MKLVNEAVLNWFKQERYDSVPRTGTLLIITFVLPKF